MSLKRFKIRITPIFLLNKIQLWPLLTKEDCVASCRHVRQTSEHLQRRKKRRDFNTFVQSCAFNYVIRF